MNEGVRCVLGAVAASLVTREAPDRPERVLRFAEFSERLTESDYVDALGPIPSLIDGFTPWDKPIVWLRLLALAELCSGLLETCDAELGLELEETDVRGALRVTGDAHIQEHAEQYVDAIETFRKSVPMSLLRSGVRVHS